MLRLLWLDARQLVRERVALWVFIAGLICSGAAAWSGHTWLERMSAERAAFLQEGGETASTYRASLAAGEITPEELALAPARVTLPLALPTPTLADFSIGRSDIEANTATVRMRYRSDTLFRNYQIDNSERLARGRIDLAFVVIVIAPLLLIVLGYGVFAGDRDRGTARLILSQAGSPVRLLAARSVNRWALVAAPIVIAGLVLLAVGPAAPERVGQAALWLGLALLSLAFWQALILFVNAFRVRAETAALSLVALWALFVFVSPAAINAGAQFLHPPPSRLALIVEGRAAEIATTSSYQNDHPELAADPSLPEVEQYRRTVARNFAIGRAIEERLSPLMGAFERQLNGQLRVVQAAQLASPPMTFAGLLASAAGTDARSYAANRRAAFENLASFKQTLAGVIEENRSFALSDYDALPRFEPPPPIAPSAIGIGVSIALTLLLGLVAVFRLRRARVD